jgi:formamidopyrimidine-DNA glycosylase
VPELPDLTVYLEALERHVGGRRLEGIQLRGISLLRSVDPPLREAEGRRVQGFRRVGKRLVLCLEGDLFLVIHLMVAGRLRWRGREARTGGRDVLAAFRFENGTLLLGEASRRKRATLHLVRGEAALREHDPGGVEVFAVELPAFRAALARESHTLKRTLTDPRILAGIGNAYSDEILHRARLSPAKLTQRLSEEEVARLFDAVRATLAEWTERLRAEVGDGFPEKVTAFREGMAVHGRFGEPCPVCGSPVQRIVHAENESNYCATCQTGGRLLADRALSRLLRADWPRTLEELEERLPGRGSRAASRRKEGAR